MQCGIGLSESINMEGIGVGLDTSDAKNLILAFLVSSIIMYFLKGPLSFLLHKYKLNPELLSALGMENIFNVFILMLRI